MAKIVQLPSNPEKNLRAWYGQLKNRIAARCEKDLQDLNY